MSERLNNREVLNLLTSENPKIDARVVELLRELYRRIDDLEEQVTALRG